ncbi:DUF2913 family protein [Enterobacter hormaechei]|nr:DUF2913 family protein [Enterobacter hormaechei]
MGMRTGHMAWCALAALSPARRDGTITSPVQENHFLTRWLATAQKQRRFPLIVATDIEWLMKQGCQLGRKAKLTTKLASLWESCTGELKAQTGLFRFTHAMEAAKDMYWICRMLSDREWPSRGLFPPWNIRTRCYANCHGIRLPWRRPETAGVTPHIQEFKTLSAP